MLFFYSFVALFSVATLHPADNSSHNSGNWTSAKKFVGKHGASTYFAIRKIGQTSIPEIAKLDHIPLPILLDAFKYLHSDDPFTLAQWKELAKERDHWEETSPDWHKRLESVKKYDKKMLPLLIEPGSDDEEWLISSTPPMNLETEYKNLEEEYEKKKQKIEYKYKKTDTQNILTHIAQKTKYGALYQQSLKADKAETDKRFRNFMLYEIKSVLQNTILLDSIALNNNIENPSQIPNHNTRTPTGYLLNQYYTVPPLLPLAPLRQGKQKKLRGELDATAIDPMRAQLQSYESVQKEIAKKRTEQELITYKYTKPVGKRINEFLFGITSQ